MNRNQQWNIRDNELSSAISRTGTTPANGTGGTGAKFCWKVANQEGALARTIAVLPRGVSVSLSGSSDDNIADDMYYAGGGC